VLSLKKLGKPEQDHVQCTARLAGTDHVHVEIGEDPLVLGQRIRKGKPLVHRVPHLGDGLLHGRGVGLFEEGTQRVHQRDGRTHEGGKLAGCDGKVFHAHPAEKSLDGKVPQRVRDAVRLLCYGADEQAL